MTRDRFEYLTTALLIETAGADAEISETEFLLLKHYTQLTLEAMGQNIDSEIYIREVLIDLERCTADEKKQILKQAVHAWTETPEITRRVMFDSIKKIVSADLLSSLENNFLESLKQKWNI